jgi:sulfate transport system ATP-binding protein
MSIEIKNITKRFNQFVALDNVNLSLPAGELTALLGPSGCGKTTLLRIIAGLEQPDTGSVHFNGADATDSHVRERKVGFVFQHYALFRHMTVFENVAFGLRVRPKASRPADDIIRERVKELLELVQLDWIADRYPAQLSGGQRQRIALARALAVEPQVLLLDEPFGALDAKVRKDLRKWLRRLHDDLHITSVFVTHDQEEALEVSDRVVVLNHGHIEQIGSPNEVYEHPATDFVYQFLGNVNVIPSSVRKGVARFGDVDIAVPQYQDTEYLEAKLFVRPHDLEISREASFGTIPAIVNTIHAIGSVVRLEVSGKGFANELDIELSRERYRELNLSEGEPIFITPKNIRAF